MGQPAVDTGALVKAIQAEPDKLLEFLTHNPGVAGMLANVYPEMARAPKKNLVVALNALPEVPALAKEFEQLVELANGTLEARPGRHSKFEFRLTLKDVQPGQTQEKLEALVAEMNALFPAMKNYPSCGFQVYLSKNGDLPNYKEAGNVVFTCSSLIDDSTNRYWDQTIAFNGEKIISQQALLARHGLVEQPIDVIRAMAGMLRSKEGFPEKQGEIGTKSDRGDMFDGMIARSKKGSSSGSAASCQLGVNDSYWGDVDVARDDVGVVGGLSPELK
jgi:hypothetical protein